MTSDTLAAALHHIVAQAVIDGEEKAARAIARLAHDLKATVLEAPAKTEAVTAQTVISLKPIGSAIEGKGGSAKSISWWRLKIVQEFLPGVLAAGLETFSTSRILDWATIYVSANPEEFCPDDFEKRSSGSIAYKSRVSSALQTLLRQQLISKEGGQRTRYRILFTVKA